MPAFVSNAAAWALRSSVAAQMAALLERWDSQDPNWLRVLTYHRIDYRQSQPALFDGVISTTPEEFAAQMRCVQTRYNVVSMADVLSAVRGGQPLPARAIVVTFDDGYRDFQEHAWPVLVKLSLPATLFVPTAYPDQPHRAFWWDRLQQAVTARQRASLTTPLGALPLDRAGAQQQTMRKLANHIKSLAHDEAMNFVDTICEGVPGPPPHYVLTWDELRTLAAAGLTIGPHTRTHPRLTKVSREEARAEILGSWQDLQQQIPQALPVFAYPDGACDDDVAAITQACGMELGFTTRRGLNYLPRANKMQLQRINVGRRSSSGALRFQLLSLARHVTAS